MRALVLGRGHRPLLLPIHRGCQGLINEALREWLERIVDRGRALRSQQHRHAVGPEVVAYGGFGGRGRNKHQGSGRQEEQPHDSVDRGAAAAHCTEREPLRVATVTGVAVLV